MFKAILDLNAAYGIASWNFKKYDFTDLKMNYFFQYLSVS
jgi:hypothetical protein